jgi:hypothetical protein
VKASFHKAMAIGELQILAIICSSNTYTEISSAAPKSSKKGKQCPTAAQKIKEP